MKKLIMILIATAFTVAVYGQTETYYGYANVALEDEKHYTFAYGVIHENKTIYISEIISCYFSNVSYEQTTIHSKALAAINLKTKWCKKVEASSGYYPNLSGTRPHTWSKSFNEVDEARDKLIVSYKKDGYNVKYISTFRYECKE